MVSSSESEAACYLCIPRCIYAEFTLDFTLPAGFSPVNPVLSYFVETESRCPLVLTEQQLTHDGPVKVARLQVSWAAYPSAENRFPHAWGSM